MLEAHSNESPAMRLQAFLTWREQNMGLLESVNQTAQKLAPADAIPRLPLIEEVELPADSSPEKDEFLIERVRLHNERAQYFEQVRGLSGEVLGRSSTGMRRTSPGSMHNNFAPSIWPRSRFRRDE